MSPTSGKLLLGAAAALLASTAVFLHFDNARLRHRLGERKQHEAVDASLRTENLVWREMLKNKATQPASVAADVAQARTEIAALEKHAEAQRQEKEERAQREAVALAANREPTQGFVRIENFADRGRATPTAAFETLIWTAVHGDEAALAKLLKFTGDTREPVEDWIAQLPEDSRAAWTPEKLGALVLSSMISDVSAIHLTGESYPDDEHAVVTFRVLGENDEEKVKFNRTPSGWKVVLPTSTLQKLEKKLTAIK